MKTLTTTLLCAALWAPLCAQTQIVRGDVDSVQNTNRFVLKCTNLPLVSTTVNLQQLHNATQQQNLTVEMTVRNIGTTSPILDVVTAQIVPERMKMGNLRFGRTETWEVFAAPGSHAWIFVNAQTGTGFIPFGAAGAWVLGPTAPPFASGPVDALGRFQIRFQMPNIPALVGQTLVSQAIVQKGGALLLTEPDCKDVRAD
jgi:hypothetical protein